MPVERAAGGTSLIDVLDRVLDKGIVIDAWVRVSLVGIDLITVEARVVVASIDTYLKYSEAVGQVAPISRPQARSHSERTRSVIAENAALRAQLWRAASAQLTADRRSPTRRARTAQRSADREPALPAAAGRRSLRHAGDGRQARARRVSARAAATCRPRARRAVDWLAAHAGRRAGGGRRRRARQRAAARSSPSTASRAASIVDFTLAPRRPGHPLVARARRGAKPCLFAQLGAIGDAVRDAVRGRARSTPFRCAPTE